MADIDSRLPASGPHARLLVMGEGGALVLLGAVAIALPGLAAVAITVLLGWLFFFSGVFGLLLTLVPSQAPGHHWSRVSAVVAVVAGVLLLLVPVGDGAAFMDVLGLFFALDGVFSILYAIEHRRQMSRRWGWMLASGALTILLAAFIVAQISISVVVLGVLVGGDLMFAGAALIIIGLAMNNAWPEL